MFFSETMHSFSRHLMVFLWKLPWCFADANVAHMPNEWMSESGDFTTYPAISTSLQWPQAII
jgi:hypothetical protein